MSSAEDYVYTFRMIIPEKNSAELENLRDELAERSGEGTNPFIVSFSKDSLLLSLYEKTEFPDERLSYAVMIAKTALADMGIDKPMFTQVIVTKKNDEKMLAIHKQIILGPERDYLVDMTDEMMYGELEK